MNILGLLERIEHVPIAYDGINSLECPDCGDADQRHNENCEIKALIDALRSGRVVVVDKQNESVCPWTEEVGQEGDPYYSTSCKASFVMLEGTAKDNDYEFCPCCAKKIVEIKKEQGE